MLWVAALAAASCGDGQSANDTQLDEGAFVQAALQAPCADRKNKLYGIDGVMVLNDRAGSCADASYAQILHGTTTNEIYCRNEDSIAGPRKHCDVAAYQGMFDTMITHLSDADLGLGPAHNASPCSSDQAQWQPATGRCVQSWTYSRLACN